MKCNTSKIKKVSRLLKIVKKIKTDDMLFLFNCLNQQAKDLLSELIYNVLHNTSCFQLSDKEKKKVRRIVQPHKKEVEYIAKKGGVQSKRNRMLRKQIGNGLITGLISVLAPIVAGLIANKIK